MARKGNVKVKDRETYNGRLTKQLKGVIPKFDKFFKKEKFKSIIEIGTGNGIFSTYISKNAKEMGASFITYDVKAIAKDIKQQLDELGCIVIRDDINNRREEIIAMIQKPERCLLLIDGADKTEPVEFFLEFLKKDDILLSHDYYKQDGDYLSKLFYIHTRHIDLNVFNDIDVIYRDLFSDYLWLCMKRN
jgi:hypothetical protein